MDAVETAFAIDCMKLLTPNEKMEILYEMMQKQKDVLYNADTYQPEPLFQKGESVLVCSQLYYFATITKVSAEFCPGMGKDVPCYKVHHKGWASMPPERIWVMEYDMVGWTRHFLPQEHLAAHWWNVFLLKTVTGFSEATKIGLFSLEPAEISDLEIAVAKGDTMKVITGTENWTMQKWMGLIDLAD